MRSILFCHGLESAPQGAKYHALVAAGLSVEAPDFQKMNLQARVDKLLDLLRDREPPVLVGSSYGGLTALCAAILHRERGGALSELILCAPALARSEAPADAMRLRAPTNAVTVIHGTRDEVVPFAVSQTWARDNPGARFLPVDDDHRLSKSLPIIVGESRRAAAS